MRHRIALWAGAGFLTAAFWAFFLFPTTPMDSTPILTLARLSCPVAFLNVGLRVYWVLLANAATYALIGLVFEALRLRTPSTEI